MLLSPPAWLLGTISSGSHTPVGNSDTVGEPRGRLRRDHRQAVVLAQLRYPTPNGDERDEQPGPHLVLRRPGHHDPGCGGRAC